MFKKEARSDRLPNVFGPYSAAIVAGDTMYLSGQAAFDVNQKLVGEGDIKEQTRFALNNIRMLLEDNGFKMDDIVRSTVYLADIGLWADFNVVYEGFFEKPYPSRTCVGCQLNGFLVEIECIAVRNKEEKI
jgi:2-iminobutanoate/2-iminopropanoate deaminase